MKAGKPAGMTRAEQIRQRRARQSQGKTKKVTYAVRYAAEAPSVFVRGGLGTPVVQRAQSRVRRKIAIPLGSPGSEMQVPSLPILHPGWRLFSGLITVLLSAILIMSLSSSDFEVGTPEIQGIQRLNRGDLQAVMNVEGTPIFMIDPRQMTEKLVGAFPELTGIAVKVKMPHHVIVSAQERAPVLAWQYDEKTLWIDPEGMVFPMRGDVEYPLLMVYADEAPPTVALETTAEDTQPAAGDSNENEDQKKEKLLTHRKVEPQVMQAILSLSNQMPAETALVFSRRDGLGWSDPRGWDVYIGSSLDDLDLKMAIYNRIVEKIESQGIQPGMISVAHIHAPFYRLEQ